eukprot:scaffold1805_cov104-Cylindrotheca_fusiformis.AAC.10
MAHGVEYAGGCFKYVRSITACPSVLRSSGPQDRPVPRFHLSKVGNSTVEFEDHENFRKEKGEFWFNPTNHALLTIAVPYRHGDHVAQRPKRFVPIINQLQELHHNKGYVHGEQDSNEGWLIDLDFGGKSGSTFYPKGYRDTLREGQLCRKKKTTRMTVDELDFFEAFEECSSKWRRVSRDPQPHMIDELKAILADIDGNNWTDHFADRLAKIGALETTSRPVARQSRTIVRSKCISCCRAKKSVY